MLTIIGAKYIITFIIGILYGAKNEKNYNKGFDCRAKITSAVQ